MTALKPEELRIGNYVWDNYSGEMIVREIYSDGITLSKTMSLPFGAYKINKLQPIPLSPEWYKKLGFVEGRNCPGWVLMEDPEKGDYVEDNVLFVDSYWDSCDYVHQLQNLYYALTGSELLIKQEKE